MLERPARVGLVGMEQQKERIPHDGRELDPRNAVRAPPRIAVELQRRARSMLAMSPIADHAASLELAHGAELELEHAAARAASMAAMNVEPLSRQCNKGSASSGDSGGTSRPYTPTNASRAAAPAPPWKRPPHQHLQNDADRFASWHRASHRRCLEPIPPIPFRLAPQA